MTGSKLAVFIALALGAAQAFGQASQREPHIGYLYPAGGQRGTTFRITAGGQFLHGAASVYVSGDGVRGAVVRHYPPPRNVSKEQRTALIGKFRELIEKRWSELANEGRVEEAPPWSRFAGFGLNRRAPKKGNGTSDGEEVKLPEHALLHDLESKSLRELLHAAHAFRNLRKGQRNAQIAETVVIEITIDRGTEPGERELRLGTRGGLTNPMVFAVGTLPEVRELETGDLRVAEALPDEPPLALPILVNGQIMPGDVDRFRFHADQGQQLVIETHARRLVPYLADAVPGWFQATLALRDAAGTELAFVDDYRFSPDPVLHYEVPQDGEYELEIRDSIYRGREDFVYRISLGERPFITSAFPLGCRSGKSRFVTIDGWNLRSHRLSVKGRMDDSHPIRQESLRQGKFISNPVTYEVNRLPARNETEGNDSTADAQRLRVPGVVDGHIRCPGDKDVFRFHGRAGDEIVAEITARRLQSPLDSLIRLIDDTGHVLAWNDDHEYKEGHLHTAMGVLTHHADSYLRTRLPRDGAYYVQVTDAQARGGDAYAYRLRIGPPQPDFELRATPSSVNVHAGFAAILSVYALRKDGFNGEIELVLKDAPDGFTLGGARIPAGRNCIRATLSAPARQMREPVTLILEGRGTVKGRVVTRVVVPAEDNTQAFLYRHLTPAKELMVAVLGNWHSGHTLQPAGEAPIQIPAGGTAQVRILAPSHPRIRELEFELNQPPPGITLRNVTHGPAGLALQLAADETAASVGLADNLIVDTFLNVERQTQKGRAKTGKRRIALGALPAIPFEIIKK